MCQGVQFQDKIDQMGWCDSMSSTRFVHLHNHSDYSLLDGAFRITDLVKSAKEMDMEAVALTDHGNLFGAMAFYREAVSRGIKPIIGMEAYITRGDMRKKVQSRRSGGYDHLTLLVRNEEGYRNLLELSSLGYLEGFYYKPRIDLNTLERFSGGLIGMSGCIQGGIPRLLLADKYDRAVNMAEKFSSIFGRDNFYIEIQNHGIDREIEVIPQLVKLSRQSGLKLVVTNDCHFCRKEDHQAHDVLLCLQTRYELDDPSRVLRSNPETYFKSPREMEELFPGHTEALKETVNIARKCNFEIKDRGYHLPNFPLPRDYHSAERYLRDLVMEKLPSRVEEVTGEIRERIEYELKIISQMDFAGYFLIVWDIVNEARSMGIPVGPGRGSAAGSMVCYVLGITSIDPMTNGLLFERLLNPERVSMPDIDIDFCDDRRQDVIDYVVERYGKENVCQIITFGRMAARAVVRDVGRVLKIAYGEVDKLAKMIPSQPGTTLSKALSKVKELRDQYDNDPRIKKMIDLSLTLEGLVRHASTHAAGLAITPTRLVDRIPLYKSTRGEITTQYDMDILEGMGILKIDILGLKTLSHISRTVELVRENYGDRLDMDQMSLDDRKTFALLRKGRTVGVFQLESQGMRDLLQRIKPGNFEDITAVNALYRPGPLGSGMVDDFIERKHGRKKITYEHPLLKPVLEETYGVILYQEQVMRVAVDVGGFTPGQADILRRAMGKKKEDVMEEQRRLFVKGADGKGVDERTAEKIFDLMAFFSGYGFNKSHSAAYAMVTMRTAYLKAHYPAAFMAAAMTCDMGDTDRLVVLLDECSELGIEVNPPDINTGEVDFALRDGDILYGLAAIKNVGVQAVSEVVAQRKEGGPYRNLYDFCDRVNLRALNTRVIESLIKSGAMDSLPGNRAQKAASLGKIMQQAQKRQDERDMGQTIMMFNQEGSEDEGLPLDEVEEWDAAQRLHEEKESLGFYFSGHPLDRYREILSDIIDVDSRSLLQKKNRERVVLAGLISDIKVILDRRGNPMAFVMVEDFHGSYELIVFSDCYNKQRDLLQLDSMVVVEGKVSVKDRNEKKVITDRIYSMEGALESIPSGVHLTVNSNELGNGEIAGIRDILSNFAGEKKVIFHINNGSEDISVLSEAEVSPGPEMCRQLKKLAGVDNVRIF